MKYFIDKLFSVGPAFIAVILTFLIGSGFLIHKESIRNNQKDAREDAQIVELVKSGTSLPEARCAVKGC